MTKLLYSATMSLDGFIAGPKGDMSWLSAHVSGEPTPEVVQLIEDIGALLVGKRTFTGDDPNAGTESEGAFGGKWQGRSIVLTHEPGPPSDDVRYVDDLHAAVDAARDAAGDAKYVNVLGADVARQCLEAGLLDEVLVFIAPVFLGDGTRLFSHPGGRHVDLEPISPDRTGPASLWFTVAGATATR